MDHDQIGFNNSEIEQCPVCNMRDERDAVVDILRDVLKTTHDDTLTYAGKAVVYERARIAILGIHI
jgi:hypothetical protein